MLKLAGELLEGQLADHIAQLDAHTFNMIRFMGSGQYLYTPFAVSVTSSAISANNLIATPFPIPIAKTVDEIGINVAVAGAVGKKAVVGLYLDDGSGYPGTLVPSSGGEVAVDATGLKVVAISIAVSKGLIWLVFNTDGAASISTPSNGITLIGGTGAPNPGSISWLKAATYSATLPATFPSGGAPTWWSPVFIAFA